MSQSSLSYLPYSTYADIEPQAKTSLGYNTNNKYPTFPPLMSDGRAVLASHQPEAVLNDHLIKSNGIESNWQYRRYLTKNATSIMKENFADSCNDNGYYKRFSTEKEDTTWYSSPHLYSSAVDSEKPKGFTTSDLKETYLSREQLNARKISPVITQDQLLRR